MSESDTATQTLEVEIDEASLNLSIFKVRSLLFEVNSVRNLAMDAERVASSPSIMNAYWLGMQGALTVRRSTLIPEQIGALGESGASLGAFAASPLGALTVGAVAAATVVGGLVLNDYQQRQAFDAWQRQMSQIAKQQGLQP